MADEQPQVSERSELMESGRKGSFIGSLIKKLIILAILAGLGYGAWVWFKQNPDSLNAAKEAVQERTDKIGGSVQKGTDRNESIEEAAE